MNPLRGDECLPNLSISFEGFWPGATNGVEN